MKKTVLTGLVIVCLGFPFMVFAKIGGGELVFKPNGASPVVFSHEVHVGTKGLKCTGCHYQLFQMTRGTYKMNMNRLVEGGFCGECHNGQRSFDVRQSKNCAKCHTKNRG